MGWAIWGSWVRIPLFTEICLTLTTQPHQKIRFLEIIFWILNMFAIVSNLQKKIYFLSKSSKITLTKPKLQTPIKPVGNIFDRRYRKKTLLNWPFPTKWYPLRISSSWSKKWCDFLSSKIFNFPVVMKILKFRNFFSKITFFFETTGLFFLYDITSFRRTRWADF